MELSFLSNEELLSRFNDLYQSRPELLELAKRLEQADAIDNDEWLSDGFDECSECSAKERDLDDLRNALSDLLDSRSAKNVAVARKLLEMHRG